MKNDFKATTRACFTGYIVQAIVNNFIPLLFLTFQRTYGIPLSKITLLVTFNFLVQLMVDLLSVTFVDRIGYRASMVLAHVFSALGLILLTVLPEIMPPFSGILIAVIVYALGGGLLEVLVSPVMEACPTDNKEAAMSLLHSFYCWGHVGVVLLSTLYFKLFGIENWKYMALLWAAVPVVNGILFTKVPMNSLIEEGERGMSLSALLKTKLFWLLLLMMITSGASEQSVSQWASALAEKELGIPKTLGDLFGPLMFAVFMGLSRAVYGKWGERINLDAFMKGSTALCILSYFGIVFFPSPVISLLCCALTGLSVGIMWPGSFSRASAALKKGGTTMFALLALGGDIGCSLGPTLVGKISGLFSDNLKKGILFAVMFPVILLICLFILGKKRTANKAS